MLNGFLCEQSLLPVIFYVISQDVTVLIYQAMPHTALGEPAGTVESLINNPYRSLILWFILLSLLLEFWFMAPRGQFWKIIYRLKHPDCGTFKVKVEHLRQKDYRCSNPGYTSPIHFLFQEDNPNYIHIKIRVVVGQQTEHGMSMFFNVFGFPQSGSESLPQVAETLF